MKYILKTYGNESVLLSDEQYFRVVQAWDSGAEEFAINDQRIPRKAISYIGFTTSAPEEQRIAEQVYYQSLSEADQKVLKEQKFRHALEQKKKIATQTLEAGNKDTRKWLGVGGQEIKVETLKEQPEALRLTSEQEENGDQAYYLEGGIKHYS